MKYLRRINEASNEDMVDAINFLTNESPCDSLGSAVTMIHYLLDILEQAPMDSNELEKLKILKNHMDVEGPYGDSNEFNINGYEYIFKKIKIGSTILWWVQEEKNNNCWFHKSFDHAIEQHFPK